MDNISEAEIIKCVSKLLDRGELDKAIKLMKEAINQKPENTQLLHAAGRLYMRLDMPATAAQYLEQSLAVTYNSEPDAYEHDAFVADDFAYLDELQEQFTEAEYVIPGSEAELEPIHKNLSIGFKYNEDEISKSKSINIRHKPNVRTESLYPPETSILPETAAFDEQEQVIHSVKDATTSELYVERDASVIDTLAGQKVQELPTRKQLSIMRDKVKTEVKPAMRILVKQRLVDVQFQSSQLRNGNVHKIVEKDKVEPVLELVDKDDSHLDRLIAKPLAKVTRPDNQEYLDFNNPVFETAPKTLVGDEESFDDELDIVLFDENELVVDLDDGSYLDSDLLVTSLDEYLDDFPKQEELLTLEPGEVFDSSEYALWEEIEESLQEVQEEEQLQQVELSETISRYDRARQKAVEVIVKVDWDKDNLPFLTQVFYENGWGAAFIAIEREILAGGTIEELMLARELRLLWKVCDRYWVTFSKLNPFSQTTDAAYRHMSWRQALKIIRVFDGIPCIEELEAFIENEFEYWYNNRIMRLRYPAFIKYLAYYRLSSDLSYLMAADTRFFDKPVEYEALNSPELALTHSDTVAQLREYGIDLFADFTPKTYYATDVLFDYMAMDAKYYEKK